MRQVVMASRRRASRSLSRLGLGPGRMASPSACTSASMSASIRANESVRWAARSLVCSSRSAAARASEACAFQGLGCGLKLRQFLGREGGEAAERVRAQPPVALVVAAVRDLQRTEGPFDRVAHALGRPPAHGELGLDFVERHTAAQALHPDCQLHDVLQAFVPHRTALRLPRRLRARQPSGRW